MTSTPRFDRVQLIHHELSQAIREADQALPAQLPAVWELKELDLFGGSLGFSPSFEELLDTYMRNFTGRNIPKSRAVHAANVCVILTPEQLEDGAHLPIRVPTFGICVYCGGSGMAGYSVCDRCAGERFSEEIRLADVLIPRHVAQGQVIPVSLQQLGIDNLYLNIHVSLEP